MRVELLRKNSTFEQPEVSYRQLNQTVAAKQFPSDYDREARKCVHPVVKCDLADGPMTRMLPEHFFPYWPGGADIR